MISSAKAHIVFLGASAYPGTRMYDDQKFLVPRACIFPSETWKNCCFSSKITWNSLELQV